ncbi:MAG: SHOCT domain-containing protein [Acidimicrobiales bacterium]
MWRDGNWGWWLFMPVVMVAFWAAVIWVAVTAVRRQPGPAQDPSRDAEQILAERYARGDIDDDEYHRRLDTLHSRTRIGEQR